MSATLAAAGRAAIERRKRRDIVNLCDLVADGLTIKDAAKLIGIGQSTATDLMAQVRRELGWQAR